MDLADLYAAQGQSQFCWWYRPYVRRGLFLGDNVVALADVGLRVAPAADPGQTLSDVSAPVVYELPPGPMQLEATERAWPEASIPDGWPLGIVSAVEVAADVEPESIQVMVDITHPAVGDLVVWLMHGDQVQVLWFMEGGSDDDLRQTFSPTGFQGSSRGTWILGVADWMWWDTGVLHSWGMNVKGPLR
jgi:hypothetical protein